MNWILDPTVSTYGPDIDRIYYLILIITGIVFVLTEVLLVYFLVKYRKREGRPAHYMHGSTRAEILWTAIPFLIVLGIALMSKGVWDSIKDPALIPPDAMEVVVNARQFEWETVYAGADGEFGTGDDFTLLNRLHIPVNRPVVVHLRSEDVIHSFFAPDFRVKQDAIPGHSIPVWFEIHTPGEYVLGCAELCGLGHYRMQGTIVVQAEGEFESWHAGQVAALEERRRVVAVAEDS